MFLWVKLELHFVLEGAVSLRSIGSYSSFSAPLKILMCGEFSTA